MGFNQHLIDQESHMPATLDSDHGSYNADGDRILFAASFDGNFHRYAFYRFFSFSIIGSLFVLLLLAGAISVIVLVPDGIYFSIIFFVAILVIIIIGLCSYYINYQKIRNRRLYITAEEVVLETKAPAICCLWLYNSRTRNMVLPLITDVTANVNWFESCFKLTTLRIENPSSQAIVNQAKKVSRDMVIVGIREPDKFKRALLAASSAKRNGMILSESFFDSLDKRYSTFEPTSGAKFSSRPAIFGQQVGMMSPPVNTLLSEQKIDSANDSMLRIEELLRIQTQLMIDRVQEGQRL